MTEIEARSKIKYRIGVIKEIAGNRYDAKFCEDLEIALQALKEIREYREIGTVEEFKALKDNQRKCEDCAGCTNWLCDCSNERAKAVDEFVKEIEAEYDNDGCPNVSDYLDYKISIRDLQKIAEHLKGGATDEG